MELIVQNVAETIIEELVARSWSPLDLVARSGIPPLELGAVLVGERRVDARIAAGLSDAFGTTEEFWLSLGRADVARGVNRGSHR